MFACPSPRVGRRARSQAIMTMGRRHEHADLLATVQRYRRSVRRETAVRRFERAFAFDSWSRPHRLLRQAEQVHRQRRAEHMDGSNTRRSPALLRLHAQPRAVIRARRQFGPVGTAAAGKRVARRKQEEALEAARRRVWQSKLFAETAPTRSTTTRRFDRRRRVPGHAARHRGDPSTTTMPVG